MRMTGAVLIGLLASLAMSPALAANAVVTGAAADLIPIPERILQGTASVRNAGTVASTPSVLAIKCQKQGGGGCAENAGMAAYTNPAYPGRLVVNVPALAPGQVYNHALPFWGALVWQPGNYNFVHQADAGGTVPETNETNNNAGVVLTKP